MLVLTRRPGESIVLEIPGSEPITITVIENGKANAFRPNGMSSDELAHLRYIL